MSVQVPRINYKKLTKTVIGLESLFTAYVGSDLSGPTFTRFARAVSNYFPTVNETYIVQTLLQYEGQKITPEWCRRLARQFAARIDELSDGVMLTFDTPSRAEWILLEVISAREAVWKENKRGVLLNLYCLTGHTAGFTIPKLVPEKWLSWLAYQIGFTRRMPYEDDFRYFLFLKFWGHVLPAEDGSSVDCDAWHVDHKCKKHNKLVSMKRMRLDYEFKSTEATCGFERDCYCWECPATHAQCDAAMKGPLDVIRVVDAGVAPAS